MMTKPLFLFSILAVLFCSCSREDTKSVFSELPTQRLADQRKVLQSDLLASPEGWKLAYSPDTAKLGNFTFLMRFKDERIVEMISDFDTLVTPPIRGEYKLLLGSSIKLSFVTRNAIHALSDSADPPSSDFGNRGYGGDFEFIYYGKDGEDLLFKGNRSKDLSKSNPDIRFKKATSQDWVELNKAKQGVAMHYLLSNPPYFLLPMKAMVLETATGKKSYTRNSSRAGRLFNWSENTLAGGATGSPISFRILSFAPQGFTTSPLMVDDVSLSTFVYNAEDTSFVAARGNKKATIRFGVSNPALYIDRSDKKGFDAFAYFYGKAFDDSNRAPANSRAFLNVLQGVYDKLLAEQGVTFSRFDIQFNIRFANDPGVYHRIQYRMKDRGGNRVDAYQYFTYSTTHDNKIVMKHAFWARSPGVQYRNYLKPISDFFVQEQGLYLKETPKFTRYSNRIFAFQSRKDRSLVAGGFYAFN